MLKDRACFETSCCEIVAFCRQCFVSEIGLEVEMCLVAANTIPCLFVVVARAALVASIPKLRIVIDAGQLAGKDRVLPLLLMCKLGLSHRSVRWSPPHKLQASRFNSS